MAVEFKIQHGLEIPKVVERNQNAHTFPWSLDLGHGDGFTVPLEYWKERDVDLAKYTAQYAKDRIRSHFKVWQSKQTGAAKAAAANLRVSFATLADKSVTVVIRDITKGTEQPATGSKAPTKGKKAA